MSRARVLLLLLFIASLAALVPWLSIDGKQYYMQLRSIVIDGDLNFYNEFAYYHPSAFRMDPELAAMTPGGYIKTWFPIGAPLLCAPFYLAGLAASLVLSNCGFPLAANGYSYPEVLAYILASTCFGLAGLMICFEIARRYFGSRASLPAVIFIWLGSPVLAYLYLEPSMAHSASIFSVALFLILWLDWRGSFTPLRSFSLGLLWGLAVMVRYQDALFVLFPLYSIFASAFGSRRLSPGRVLLLLSLLLLGGLVSLSPQMILWKAHYGSFLAVPQGRGFFTFLSPAVWSVLFSSYHGLYSWTPILLIASIGVVALLRVDRPVAVIFLVIFCLQVYFSSISKDWWGGWAFGARRFISFTPAFILGLAALLGARRRLTVALLAVLCSLLVIWNMLFIYQYYTMKLPFGGNVSLISVAGNQWPSLCELAGASLRFFSPGLLAAALAGLLLAFGAAVVVHAIFGRLVSVRRRWIYAALLVVYFLAWDAVMVYEAAVTKRVFFVDEELDGRRPVRLLTLGVNGVFEGMGEDLDLDGGRVVLDLRNERPFSALTVVSYCGGGSAGDVVGRVTVEYESGAPSEHEIVYGRETYSPVGAPPPRGPLAARTWYEEKVELPPYRTPLPLPLWLLRAWKRTAELMEHPPEPRRSYAATMFLGGGGVPARVVIEAAEGQPLVITGLAFRE